MVETVDLAWDKVPKDKTDEMKDDLRSVDVVGCRLLSE